MTTGLNSISDIPRPWRQALAAIQQLFPAAVMAGGCLRDREHGVAVKDIDIFLPSPNDRMEDADHVRKVLEGDGWQDVKLVHDETYMSTGNGRMVAAVETRYPGCPPIQINIGGWNMDHLAEDMDFGICQISFDGRKIHRSVAYQRDARLKQFRLAVVVDDERFVRSINRWARLKAKYPKWTFHLGTRASGFGSGYDAVQTRFHNGGVVTHSQAMRQAWTRLYQTMPTGRLPQSGPNLQQLRKEDSLIDALARNGGEVVLPSHLVDRLTKPIPSAKVVGVRNNMATVKVSVNDVPKASEILRDMLEAKRRFEADLALKRGAHC